MNSTLKIISTNTSTLLQKVAKVDQRIVYSLKTVKDLVQYSKLIYLSNNYNLINNFSIFTNKYKLNVNNNNNNNPNNPIPINNNITGNGDTSITFIAGESGELNLNLYNHNIPYITK